jgi:hypothetical protein
VASIALWVLRVLRSSIRNASPTVAPEHHVQEVRGRRHQVTSMLINVATQAASEIHAKTDAMSSTMAGSTMDCERVAVAAE